MYWIVSKARRPTRMHHAAVAVRQSVYSFGGPYDDDTSSDATQIHVHIFNTVSLSWTELAPAETAPLPTAPTARRGGRRSKPSSEVPCNRAGHTAVLVGSTVYIWGGITHGRVFSTNDTYAFDVDTHRWSKLAAVSGTVPGARCGHSACVVGASMYVHGGLAVTGDGSGYECNCKVYRLDTASMLWSQVKTRGTLPPASMYHSATVIGTRMFIFGGLGDHRDDYNVRALDTATGRWLDVPAASVPPEARFAQSAFAHGGQLYVFGGCNLRRSFGDLWRFDPHAFSWRKVEPLGYRGPSRMYSTCCCVVAEHRVVVFGGYRGRCTVAAVEKLHVLDFRPALKTLCKVAVVRGRLRRSGLPHNVRWELLAMTDRRRVSNNVSAARVATTKRAADKRKSDEPASTTLPDNNKVRRVTRQTNQ